MSDYLVNLGQNKALQPLLKAIGIPTPQKLQRAEGPWKEKALSGNNILTGYSNGNLLEQLLPKIYQKLGAGGNVEGETKFNALVFDATGIQSIADLESLYQFYHESIRQLGTCGRVLIITRQPKENSGVEEITTFQAIEGFMRSLAKEIGRKGATANIVQLGSDISTADLENALLPVLHFMLSERSVYVDSQVIRLSSKVKFPDEMQLEKALKGKTALVTGAARGIGEATARILAREGAKVLIVDVPALKDIAEKVTHQIGGALLLMDITQQDAPKKINEFITANSAGLDILISTTQA